MTCCLAALTIGSVCEMLLVSWSYRILVGYIVDVLKLYPSFREALFCIIEEIFFSSISGLSTLRISSVDF